MRVRVKFSKYGVMKFIGHLDVMRYFQKAMRRAGIDIAYSEGMSPHMIMSFAQPLGVGLTSDGEYMDVELRIPIASDEAIRRLNEVGVEGITVTEWRQIPEEKGSKAMTLVAAADYELAFPQRTGTKGRLAVCDLSFLRSEVYSGHQENEKRREGA